MATEQPPTSPPSEVLHRPHAALLAQHDVRLADVLAHQPRRIGATVILDNILQAVAEHNRGYHPDDTAIMVVLA